MHVIIGLLGSIVTILYLVNRLANLGIDFSRLNPFHWRRRRAWSKKYDGDPIYSITDPIHVAAILILGVARLEGEATVEQKNAAIDQFASSFSLDTGAASDLYTAAVHLLGAPQVIEVQLDGVAKKNVEQFAAEQTASMIDMMVAVASTGGKLSSKQRLFIDGIRAEYLEKNNDSGTWS